MTAKLPGVGSGSMNHLRQAQQDVVGDCEKNRVDLFKYARQVLVFSRRHVGKADRYLFLVRVALH